jgi:uncharacterized membrane protein YfcA
MSFDPLGLALLIAAGIVAGWINTLAGGGSMLTVPALMWLGLPADVANGTSRIAILAQGATGVIGFHRARRLETDKLWSIAVPTVIGAVLGAYAATLIPNAIFRPLLIGTFVLMAGTMFLSPSTLAPAPDSVPVSPSERPLAWVVLLLAGFYGGFLQAGVGFILLAVFGGMLRIDLVRGNALKVAVVFVYTAIILLIFAAQKRLDAAAGLVLALGNVIGAELGVRFAVKRGQTAIHRVVFATIVVSCIALLFKP